MRISQMNYLELYAEWHNEYSKYSKRKIAYWFAKKGGFENVSHILEIELTCRDEYANLLKKKHTLPAVIANRTESVNNSIYQIKKHSNGIYL